jgi:hypothetical protein
LYTSIIELPERPCNESGKAFEGQVSHE